MTDVGAILTPPPDPAPRVRGHRIPPLRPGADLLPRRPLTPLEVLAGAVRLVRYNRVLLLLPSALIAALGAALTITLVWTNGQVREYFAAGPRGFTVGSPAIDLVCLLIAGLAPAVATVGVLEGAVGRRLGWAALRHRLGPTWPTALLVGLTVSVVIAVGLLLRVLPGMIAIGVLSLAVPVAVAERRGYLSALRRSLTLSWPAVVRIIVLTLLAALVVGAGSLLASTATRILGNGQHTVGWMVLIEVVTAVVVTVLGAVQAAVAAVLYVDTRMRVEGVAGQRISAAARHQ